MISDNAVFDKKGDESLKVALFCLLVLNACVTFSQDSPSLASNDGSLLVPRLLNFNGVLKDAEGVPRIGVAGIRFAIYSEEVGGVPLWQEIQNLQLDSQGLYSVHLGATKAEGVPPELFASGEPRWLGVQALFPGEQEQPRVLLVSVPYALKAGNADTLGGLPPTAFLRAAQGGNALGALSSPGALPAPTGVGMGAFDVVPGTGNGPRAVPSAASAPATLPVGGICYANDYPGGDIFAKFNSAIATCKGGEIRIRQGTYVAVKTTAKLTQPADSMVCEGAVTIDYIGSGDAIDWRMTPFSIAPAGRIEGCKIVGTASGASGLHMGDIVGWTLDRVVISGFTRAGASGIWWDNRSGWIERGTITPSVAVNNNAIGFRMTNSGGTPLTDSFCYDRVLGLALDVGQNQIGISTESGKFCHGTMITTINGLGANKTLISLSGPGLWQDGFYQITTEDDGGGGTRLAIGPGAGLTGMGLFDHYGTSAPMGDSILGGLYLYFPHLNAVGMWYADQNSNINIGAFPGATSSNNVSAPFIQMRGQYWNGTATSADSVIVQEVLGTGANPSSTYTISHSGSTGPFGLLLKDGTGHGLYLSTSAAACSNAPCIRHDSADNLTLDTGSGAALFLNSDNNKPIQTGTGPLLLKGHLGQLGAGRDLAGTIEIGASDQGDRAFTKAFNSTPVCTITPTKAIIPGTVWWVTSSPASVVAHVTPPQTATFNYHCIGQPD